MDKGDWEWSSIYVALHETGRQAESQRMELHMETHLSLLYNKSRNGLINNLKASKNTITDSNLVQGGDFILLPGRRIHRRHHTGNKAATGSEFEAGIRGKHPPGLNSNFSWQSTAGADRHLRRTTFSHAQLLHRRVFTCC